VLIGVITALRVYVYSYIKGKDTYDKVADIAFEVPPDADSSVKADGSQPFVLTIDWDALVAINPDIVG
jgi:hypothetical protein